MMSREDFERACERNNFTDGSYEEFIEFVTNRRNQQAALKAIAAITNQQETTR